MPLIVGIGIEINDKVDNEEDFLNSYFPSQRHVNSHKVRRGGGGVMMNIHMR